jgi:hypothetical protein
MSQGQLACRVRLADRGCLEEVDAVVLRGLLKVTRELVEREGEEEQEKTLVSQALQKMPEPLYTSPAVAAGPSSQYHGSRSAKFWGGCGWAVSRAGKGLTLLGLVNVRLRYGRQAAQRFLTAPITQPTPLVAPQSQARIDWTSAPRRGRGSFVASFLSKSRFSPPIIAMLAPFRSAKRKPNPEPHTIIIGLRHHGHGVVCDPAGLRDRALRMLQVQRDC